MRIASLLLVVAACQGGGEQRPINPGGGDDVVSPTVDASSTTDGTTIDGTGLSGRVCVVSDMRALSTCAATGADGLTVTLEGQTATTAADGSFTIATPSGSSLVWRVSGTSIVSTVMPFSASTLIPAVPATLYDSVALANGVIINAGEGSVIGRVVHATNPISGAVAAISPVATYDPFYDGSSATAWNQNQTGTRGVFWIPGSSTGTPQISVETLAGDVVSVGVPVEGDAITFAAIEVP